jgi:hypothetical protein
MILPDSNATDSTSFGIKSNAMISALIKGIVLGIISLEAVVFPAPLQPAMIYHFLALLIK